MQTENWEMEDMFDACDQDKKGYISVLDFQVVLSFNRNKNYNMRDIEYLLRMYDKDGMQSRKVSFEDFANQLKSHISSQF